MHDAMPLLQPERIMRNGVVLRQYQPRCACGWQGATTTDRAAANAASERHNERTA